MTKGKHKKPSYIILSKNTGSLNQLKTEIFEINQILNEEYAPHLFNGTWISGDEFIFKSANGSIVLFDANINKVKSIYVQSYIVNKYNIKKFSISADRRFILLVSDYQKAKFIIYNIINENVILLEKIIAKDKQKQNTLLQLAEWGPLGNSLIFVSFNDLYFIPFIGGEVKRITNNGNEGNIFNGIADFLYRETILAKESMIWWSEEGSKLCFATIDDTLVQESALVYYGSLSQISNDSIEIITYKYPKAKQNIPKVSLRVTNINSGSLQQITPPNELLNKDYYIIYVNWVNKDSLTVVWTLRNQNQSIISLCSEINKWICKEVITISSKSTLKKLAQSFLPSDDGIYFMICLRPDSLIGSYFHVIAFNINERFIESFITYGRYDVTKLLFYHKVSQTLYFEASLSIIAEKRHIYKVETNTRHVLCITCNLTNINCHYFEAIFSLTAQFYALQCMGPSIPKVFLFKLDSNQNEAFLFESNQNLRNKLHKKLGVTYKTFPINLQNKKLQLKLLIPPDFDAEHFAKYPLVIEANSPENSVITEKFDIGWSHYLVSNHKYIYGWIECDLEMRRQRQHLQNYELINENIEDIGLVINYIKKKMPFINKHRICIFGTTIGGFIGISALASSDASCAIAVSPVINWRHMDAVTSEHLSNSWHINDNYDGNYAFLESINLFNKVDKLTEKPILFIHGSADEKVQIIHTMQITKYFINQYIKNGWERSKPLHQLQLYPDEDHSLHNVRHHKYQTMEAFLQYCFK